MARLSRRSLLTRSAAALALTPVMARAETGTRIPAPDDKLPAQKDNIQGSQDASDHLTVDTYVNDKGPFRFVVDTGADRTVISDTVAASLGLPSRRGNDPGILPAA